LNISAAKPKAGVERDDIRASGPNFGFEIGPSMPRAIEAGGGRAGILIDGHRFMPRFEGDRAYVDVPRAAAVELLAHDLWRTDNTTVARELMGDDAT
jgi:hypothetical protein